MCLTTISLHDTMFIFSPPHVSLFIHSWNRFHYLRCIALPYGSLFVALCTVFLAPHRFTSSMHAPPFHFFSTRGTDFTTSGVLHYAPAEYPSAQRLNSSRCTCGVLCSSQMGPTPLVKKMHSLSTCVRFAKPCGGPEPKKCSVRFTCTYGA